ncbi:B3gnt6 [Symbiodinium necroappetens]|uniref:Hexosyltransferase n=1 Tax=Symbiodinium necroappetens TaxID=1628268 RepID=A0A813CI14_9DINO|nr:B3gnt6 [Symbiodinium necroappetens]
MPRKRGTATCSCGCGRCHFAFLAVLLLVVLSVSTLRFMVLVDTGDRHVRVRSLSAGRRRRPAKTAQDIPAWPLHGEPSVPSYPLGKSAGHGAPVSDSVSDETAAPTSRSTTACSKELQSTELAPGLRSTTCSARAREHVAPLFVAVTSPIGNFKLRAALRSGHWLMKGFPASSRASYMFFVGSSPDQKVQERLEQEMRRHADIVQFDFADRFTNLAVKSVGAAAWVHAHLNVDKVQYVLKVEDYMTNSFAKIDEAVKGLQVHGNQKPYYGGGMIFGGTPVVRDGRWGCPRRHCPYETYPVEYAGGQYLLSRSAVKILVQKALPALDLSDPYPVEDHYVASFLAESGVHVVNEPKLMWAAGKPYGAPSIVADDFLLCLDTEDRPETAHGEAGAWEGSTLVMLPEERAKKAWYGDPSHPWSSDHGKDVTESVLESLREKQQVRAWDASWGDPAPGVRKVLLLRLDQTK